MNSIQHQKLNLPSEAPVMVLPGTLLFPSALLPLYIFEPRYRAMLAHVLARDRMFCVAAPRPGVSEPHGIEDFRPVAAIGLVRACVSRGDGSSHLILQGLARVRFRGFLQETPYRIAQIQELSSTAAGEDPNPGVTRALVELCRQAQTADPDAAKKIDQQLSQISDPSILSDVIAHTFLRDPENRQDILEMLNTERRMQLVLAHLRAELAR